MKFMCMFIVIPAYNESRTITEVIRGCKKYANEVIVVNDGSSDDTALYARRAGAVVYTHLVNRGYGAALQTGIQAALMRGAGIIVTIDADGQHEPEEIPHLVLPLTRGRQRGGVDNEQAADIVIGDRFGAESKREGMSILRKLLITAGNLLTWILYGVWLSDTQSGFRAYTYHALETLIDSNNFRVSPREFPRKSALRSEGMEFSSEIIGEAARQGLTIATVPITVRYTDYSLGKGQNLFTGIGTAFRLFMRRIMR